MENSLLLKIAGKATGLDLTKPGNVVNFGPITVGTNKDGVTGISMGPGKLVPLKSIGGAGGDGKSPVKIKPPGKDVDFPIRKKKESLSGIYKPKVPRRMKDGGAVRGCGAAQRGKTRGKMV